MENNNEQEKVIIKYSSYTPAQKRATQRYRQNNKDKVNEQRKKYYEERKERDPAFLEYKRTKAKEYYQRKKAKEQPKEPQAEPIVEQPLQVEPIEPLEDIKQQIEPVIEILQEAKERLEKEKPEKGTKRKTKIQKVETENKLEKLEELDNKPKEEKTEGNLNKEKMPKRTRVLRKQPDIDQFKELPVIPKPDDETNMKPIVNVKKCFRKKI